MRYVIADIHGRSHAYFDGRAEAREALFEFADEDPASIVELYVVGYADDGGRGWGPVSAADVMLSLDWSGDEWDDAVDLQTESTDLVDWVSEKQPTA